MLHKSKQQTLHLPTQSSKETEFCCPSFEQIKGSQVFVSLKKPNNTNPVKKQPNQQNVYQALKKPKSPSKKDKKTIESTIKQLLKGKQELANYLESQKQFIQVLDFHDHELRYWAQSRGKLSSSLTEKKKSRIDTYTMGKNCVSSHLSKNSHINAQIFNAQHEALTMQVLKREGNSYEPSQISDNKQRQYETVSFHDVYSEYNQAPKVDAGKQKYRKRQKKQKLQKGKHAFAISSKQNNYLPGQQCFVMTSPKRKNLKLNERSNFEHNSFYATKYGLTHFSPWAFPKNDYDNEIGQNPSVIQDRKIDEQKVFRQKSMNQEAKSSQNQAKNITKQGQSVRIQNKRHQIDSKQKQTLKEFVYDHVKGKENIDKVKIQVGSQKRYNSSIEQRYLHIETNNGQKDEAKSDQKVKAVKSQQVIILQSGATNAKQIFASRQNAKQIFHPRKSLKFKPKEVNRTSMQIEREERIFTTEVHIKERNQEKQFSNEMKYKDGTDMTKRNELTKQSELGELKKTEEFLKEIMLAKNSVSYSNSRSISKKDFKQTKTSNVFATKNLLKNNNCSHQSSVNQQLLTLSQQEKLMINEKFHQNIAIKEKQSDKGTEYSSSDIQNSEKYQSDSRKKPKTSLDNPFNVLNVQQFISTSNTKCLTEASLNGFYMIKESKIRNTKNSFVRRKRHSMMVKNKASEEKKAEQNQRRYSCSIEKEVAKSICDMSILEESKGFGIINPLTKQLYKKYVSIVQNKR